jgi:hypothetical protein
LQRNYNTAQAVWIRELGLELPLSLKFNNFEGAAIVRHFFGNLTAVFSLLGLVLEKPR